MKEIYVGDYGAMSPESRQAMREALQQIAEQAGRQAADHLLREVIVRVRAVHGDATSLLVKVGRCEHSDCDLIHGAVVEIRDSKNVALWRQGEIDEDDEDDEDEDEDDEESEPWASEGSLVATAHGWSTSMFVSAATHSWLTSKSVSVPPLDDDLYVLTFRF